MDAGAADYDWSFTFTVTVSLIFAFPAIVVYGIFFPLLWLSEKLHPHFLMLRDPVGVEQSRTSGSATACIANGYDQYYARLQEDCVQNALKHWWSCGLTLPPELPRYSPSEQVSNLRAMTWWHTLFTWFSWLPGFQQLLRFKGLKIWNSALCIPSYDPAAIMDFYDDISAATRFFVNSRDTLQTGLDDPSLFGAVRLLWFICAFQVSCKKKVDPDAALVAYCLIYPLTDNYLDDPALSREEKYAFNQRLRQWIQDGVPNGVKTAQDTEDLVCYMLRIMANAWPMKQHQAVHYSLNAIHTAQSLSVEQCQGFGKCSDAFLEEVSAMKGGASLLAAGYLIQGNLVPDDLKYLQYLGLGFQLLDDLQDIKDDQKEQRCTLFTDCVYRQQPLDGRLAKLLQYVARPQALGPFVGRHPESLADYLLISIVRVTTFLVLEAAAQMQDFISPRFLSELEALSPVPLRALKSFQFEYRLFDIMRSGAL